MFQETIKPIRIFYYICLSVIFFFMIVWISALMTIFLLNLAAIADGSLGNYIIDHGAARAMRRVLMFWAALVIIWSLKKIGWQGWKDCGWTDGRISEHLSGFGWGALFGLISMGGIAVMTIRADVHHWQIPDESAPQLIGTIFAFAAAGLAVALIEETVCRGILFRPLSRRWGAWPAAIGISLLFGIAHFISPSTANFHGNSFIAVSLNATLSTFSSLIPPKHDLVQFLNLVLLGILLCVLVMRTKTIWMSVGAHAAWVFVIKLHSKFTLFNADSAPCAWMGKRNDFMDSPITALILAIFILLFSRWKPSGLTDNKVKVKIRDQTWYFQPSKLARLGYFPDRGEDFFADAKILKKYPGCLVVKKSGLVFKKYFPKNAWDKLRFTLHPSRVKHAFMLSRELIAYKVPTPPVLGWTARRFGKDQYEAMIVTEVQNAEPLTDWLTRDTKDPDARLKVMEAYGNLMADFHAHGYSNRDLKHENVMCLKGTPWVLQVVDLDGVRKKIFITRRRAGKDLFRIGDSLASLGWNHADEIAAFFKAYNAGVPPRLQFQSFPA